MALISEHGGVKAPSQTSRMVSNPIGSGSRPVPSKVKIDSSAPHNPQTLGRDPGGALKQTS